MSDRDDARDELVAIAGSLRALLEWHEGTGTTGFPAAPRAAKISAASAPTPATRAVAVASAATAPSPPAPRPVSRFPSEIPATLREAGIAPSASSQPVVASSTASGASQRQHLAVLAEEVRGCTRCGLHAGRKKTVFARGNPASDLVFVGEGPGADEDAQGAPFVGRAGQLLDKMIAAMGYQRDDVYICNIVKCRPPENRKPEPNEMEACSPYLTKQLELVEPKVIVALGATAVQGLIGTSEGITRMRGKWKLYKGRVPIMPTFHPAYLLRQPGAKREVWSDLQEVMRLLGRSPKPAS